MAPSRSQASNINSVYTLSLLSEYNHTLDSLPLDLSRNFADLRELDAVLSSSMASIIVKIRNLTHTIENGSSSKQDRLILLADIADEAARLKLGGEDKIRVACQAADNLGGHIDHMRILLGQIPSFDASVLSKKTTYPHISTRSYMPIPENSRRKRNNYGSIMNSAPDVSPAKRKRNPRDDDIDITGGKSPRKDNRFGDAGPSRSRNGARSRKCVYPPSHLTVLDAWFPDQIARRPQQSLSSRSRRISHHQRLNHMPVLHAPRHTPAAVVMVRIKDQKPRLPLSHMTIPSQTVYQRAVASFPGRQPLRPVTRHSLCRIQMVPMVYTTTNCPMAMQWQTTGLVRHRTHSWRDQACLLRVALCR